MEKQDSIFEKHYENYLEQLNDVDLSRCESIMGISVNEEKGLANIPFFKTIYQVSPLGVMDERGRRPDYGICVVLLKYLLMCPERIPTETDWISYRDFKDSGQAQNSGLSSYASQAISRRYTGNIGLLKAAVNGLGGRPPETEYPYDISAVLMALPRIPILFLFNDAEEQFPAQASILYERRAASFLDAECRVMIDWYLLEYLKRLERPQGNGKRVER
jgi:hypothetical protein